MVVYNKYLLILYFDYRISSSKKPIFVNSTSTVTLPHLYTSEATLVYCKTLLWLRDISCSNLTVFLESFSLLWKFVISCVLDCIFFICITAVLNISVPPAWQFYVTCSSFSYTNIQQSKIDTSQHDTKLKFRGKWWISPFNKILNNLKLISSLFCVKILSAVVTGPGFPSLRIVKPAVIFHMWHILYPEIILCLILLVTCSVICNFIYGIYDYTAVQILLNHDRTIIVTCDNYGKTWTLESEVIIIWCMHIVC